VQGRQGSLQVVFINAIGLIDGILSMLETHHSELFLLFVLGRPGLDLFDIVRRLVRSAALRAIAGETGRRASGLIGDINVHLRPWPADKLCRRADRLSVVRGFEQFGGLI
jgi:hypothetical protein